MNHDWEINMRKFNIPIAEIEDEQIKCITSDCWHFRKCCKELGCGKVKREMEDDELD